MRRVLAIFTHFHSLTPLRNQLLKKKTPRANRRRERPSRIHEPALTVLKSQKQGQSNESSKDITRGRSLGERGARFQKSIRKASNGFWMIQLYPTSSLLPFIYFSLPYTTYNAQTRARLARAALGRCEAQPCVFARAVSRSALSARDAAPGHSCPRVRTASEDVRTHPPAPVL